MMPELIEQLTKSMQDQVSGVHTAVPAEIKSFDSSTMLAVVAPKAVFKKPDGSTIAFPQISGVPVVFPHNKDFSISFPIKEGDGCLLIFAEQSLDFWLYGKQTDTELKHDLSNAIAIPNISTQADKSMQEACAESAIVLSYGDTKVKIKKDGVFIKGKVEIEGDVKIKGNTDETGNINVTGGITATADVTASGKSLKSHTHTDSVGGSTTAPH